MFTLGFCRASTSARSWRKLETILEQTPELAPVARDSDRGIYFDVTGPEFVDAGYSYSLTGEVATMRDSLEQFLQGFLLAVVLVYLVLVLQFRSFRDPLIIMLTVPLGLIGVSCLLYLGGNPVSMMSAMGIIMMVGLVVAYSILLVDFADRKLAGGAPRPKRSARRQQSGFDPS